MGLPGGRGSPIERCDRDPGQAAPEPGRVCVWTWSSCDRSTAGGRAAAGLDGGDAWPPVRCPQPPGTPRPAPATRRVSGIRQPRMGGLLSPFGDPLLSQHLAQPGMLVVHVPTPSGSSTCFPSELVVDWSSLASSEWRRSMSPESGICLTRTLTGSPSLAAGSLRVPFRSGRSRGIIPARWASAWRARPLSAASRSCRSSRRPGSGPQMASRPSSWWGARPASARPA
jgi:hypothetical protein